MYYFLDKKEGTKGSFNLLQYLRLINHFIISIFYNCIIKFVKNEM